MASDIASAMDMVDTTREDTAFIAAPTTYLEGDTLVSDPAMDPSATDLATDLVMVPAGTDVAMAPPMAPVAMDQSVAKQPYKHRVEVRINQKGFIL